MQEYEADENVELELQVNGKSVGMNPFVKTVFHKVIVSLVSSLKKTEGASEIVIRLKMKG
jgi:hypothetical protein